VDNDCSKQTALAEFLKKYQSSLLALAKIRLKPKGILKNKVRLKPPVYH
jgi:hypothetical protein